MSDQEGLTTVSEESLKIAVFIDYDNIEIGVRTTLNREFDVGAVLDAVKERGEVITKVAYGDWKRAGEYSRMLTQHAVRMVQRNVTPGGDKNGADINLALDALELAFTHDHINAFVIVGGDSDFISLVEKLKQYDRKVFVVGGRQFTAMVLQKNCYEFIAYENLIRQPSRRQSSSGRDRAGTPAAAPPPSTLTTAPVNKAFPLVTRALQLLVDREVTPQLGLLKSTLLQLDSTFSERDYGASSFRDFAEKLAQAGLVALRSAGRSVLVELKETDEGNEAVEGAPVETEHVAAPASAVAAGVDGEPQASARADAPQPSIVDGIRLLQRVLATPGTIPRWPMYVRNVKQAMRAADPGFDERRHGNLVEILRSVQRDGLIRLDRDRQGVLRVFQGPQLRLPAVATAEPAEGAAELDLTATSPAETDLAVIAGAATGAETTERTDAVAGDEHPAMSAQSVEPAEASGETTPAAEPTRRRRKAGAAAPKATSTTARKPRARTTTPRKRKETGTE
jgi:uncharacterized LabA/DUF88 family protein